jgi:hypothetical protein
MIALKGLFFLLIFAGGLALITRWVSRRLKRDEMSAVTEDERKSIVLTRWMLIAGAVALEALIFAIAIAVIVQ